MVEKSLSDGVIALPEFLCYTVFTPIKEDYSMTIGEKIRHYRLKNELTQEKLAAEVAVSYQAVSKWERNESLPDVTVIARLADALHVTCDTLLTDNGCFTEREIDGILRDAAQLSSQDHDEYRRRVRLLETALEKHPRSFRLMAALAETYSMGAAYPEFTELDYLGRTVDLEETIAAHCTDPKLRNQTTQMLCYLYRGMGRFERIRELADGMPEICQTRPALIYHAMPGETQNEGIHAYFTELLDSAECILSLLIYPNAGDDEKAHFDALRKTAGRRELWNTERYED